jgi:hypothetical protein
MEGNDARRRTSSGPVQIAPRTVSECRPPVATPVNRIAWLAGASTAGNGIGSPSWNLFDTRYSSILPLLPAEHGAEWIAERWARDRIRRGSRAGAAPPRRQRGQERGERTALLVAVEFEELMELLQLAAFDRGPEVSASLARTLNAPTAHAVDRSCLPRSAEARSDARRPIRVLRARTPAR